MAVQSLPTPQGRILPLGAWCAPLILRGDTHHERDHVHFRPPAGGQTRRHHLGRSQEAPQRGPDPRRWKHFATGGLGLAGFQEDRRPDRTGGVQPPEEGGRAEQLTGAIQIIPTAVAYQMLKVANQIRWMFVGGKDDDGKPSQPAEHGHRFCKFISVFQLRLEKPFGKEFHRMRHKLPCHLLIFCVVHTQRRNEKKHFYNPFQ